MLFGITFLGLFCGLNAFFIKDGDHIFQDVDSNSSLSKGVDFGHNSDIFGSDTCSCKNGRCVKDTRGIWKCMCFPKHSLKGKDCELCDCGKKGKCIFTETFSEETRSIQYEKQCVCDTGYADKYGTCTECVCGVNSKCEFEYGEKICYCMEGYAELNGVCTECNCGEGGYCEFHSGQKICTCYEGYLFDGHICKEGCYKDDDCGDRQKCLQESDDWKTCQCADGLSGAYCEENDWCEDTGIFKDCKGVNGTCDYDEEKRSIDCKCATGKKLHPEENRCRETCTNSFECEYDGKCIGEDGNSFCLCKFGLIGDKCETVSDCSTKGKYNGCVDSGGECIYDGSKAVCQCFGNKKLHDQEHICKECDCGEQGACRFVYGKKQCDCPKGFLDKDGTCTEGCYKDDDCGSNQKCLPESDDWKICLCADGLSGDNCEEKDWCKGTGIFKDCKGINGTCDYDEKKRSVVCKCAPGKKLHPLENRCRDTCDTNSDCENGGTCGEDRFCSCKLGLIGDKCETIFDCTSEGKYKGCVESGGKCIHDGSKAVCECWGYKNYHDAEHICKECDCGPKGTCRFENGEKKCECESGFALKDEMCTATCFEDMDCEDNQKCSLKDDWKSCRCADGLSGDNCEQKDWCRETGIFKDCRGVNGTCDYDESKRSVDCKCAYGKKLHSFENRCRDTCDKNDDCKNGGACKRNFCYCIPGLIGDKCETIFDCTSEGRYKGCESGGGKCTHDGSRAVCECPFNKKYLDTEHTCKECDCGPKGACRFENGQKRCECLSGFAVKDGICTATCSNDDGCNYKQKCVEKDGWKTCVCADGLSGANCEKKNWCESDGKFKNCRAENGTCDYVKDKRSVDCICAYGKVLHPHENRCRDTCSSHDDCENGGTCVGNFCSCNSGLLGDKCEEVLDCTPHGKYKDCESSGGRCYYDGSKAICECSGKKILHDKQLICKVCDCGENGQCSFVGEKASRKCSEEYSAKNRKCENCHCGDHGSCAFDYEEKICLCNKGYSEKNGKCEICDCGENGYCSFQGDEKVCKCDPSYSENYGKCESCDCGEGGWCAFINGKKTCECGDGYSEQNGKCEICDCGVRGSCYFVGDEKLCKCEDGYAEKNGRCEVCSCGKNTVCKFIYGAKACQCLQGYMFNDVTGECEECDCGLLPHGFCTFLNGKKTCLCERGFKEDLGKCKECDCGGGAVNCSFVGGQKHCACAVGFAEENGRCKRLQSCDPNPCVNGHCVSRENDFLCVCDNPFTGRYCEISSCIETKCIGGRCRVIGNREECICPVGHKLGNGTCTKTFCVEKKCYDGECVIQNGVETCICPEDYVSEGNECRKVKCSGRSCIGGSCRIIRGNIEDCVCPIGHVLIEDTCTITTCTPRTCYGGRCEKRDDELVCICPDGFHLEGVGCIETTCKEQNCFGGKCRVLNGKEICTCLDGYILKNDQCQKVRCVEKHCFGGKCDVVDGEEVCSCPVGFEVQGDVCREI